MGERFIRVTNPTQNMMFSCTNNMPVADTLSARRLRYWSPLTSVSQQINIYLKVLLFAQCYFKTFSSSCQDSLIYFTKMSSLDMWRQPVVSCLSFQTFRTYKPIYRKYMWVYITVTLFGSSLKEHYCKLCDAQRNIKEYVYVFSMYTVRSLTLN